VFSDSLPEFLTTASGMLFVCGMIPYYFGIFGVRRPAPIVVPILSFLIWLGTDLLQVAGGLFGHGNIAIPLAATIATVIVLVFASYTKHWEIRLDVWNIATAATAIVALVAWMLVAYTTDSATGALVAHGIALFAGGLGAIPMWRAMWKDRRSQGTWMWLIWLFATGLGVFAVAINPEASWQDHMAPGWYFFVTCVTNVLRFYPRPGQ
jgi:hypothetical protein